MSLWRLQCPVRRGTHVAPLCADLTRQERFHVKKKKADLISSGLINASNVCLFLVVESILDQTVHQRLEKSVFSVVNHRRPEAVRYTPPWRAMLRFETQEESRIPLPDHNSTYFHSSSDAVYFENIPIFMAGHHSRFKVLPQASFIPSLPSVHTMASEPPFDSNRVFF